MTHSLHRTGDREGLEKDYCVLVLPHKGINDEGARPKLIKILDIMESHDPVNLSDQMTGKTKGRNFEFEEIKNSMGDYGLPYAVYRDKETVQKVIREIKKGDFGISVVISGVFEEVFSLLNDSEDNPPFPHTINTALGVHGKEEALPEPEILEIATMCGHGLVSHNLIRDRLEKVANGSITAQKAAEDCAQQCVCGIFNTKRAKELFDLFSDTLMN